ncbi:unnamed protein product [Sphagnum troendelagicum]|uniref:Uncharacterized protein n=1 Tax=Sphagnum troendelagicum TaxID=128251 RepID=A0ABP0V2T7_9BRYO
MIGYVSNKKAKSRKINYEKCNKQIGYNVIKVSIDNDICISGYVRMYKDNVDNVEELFKSALVDKATHSCRPPKPNTMCNMPSNDDNVDVQVYDDDDVFDMVNVGSPG